MIEGDLADIWVYLSASPLTGLTLTLVSYLAAYFMYQKSGYNSLLNPVLIAVVMIIAVLWITGTKYLDYFCLLYTSPSPRDATLSRMPSSA